MFITFDQTAIYASKLAKMWPKDKTEYYKTSEQFLFPFFKKLKIFEKWEGVARQFYGSG